MHKSIRYKSSKRNSYVREKKQSKLLKTLPNFAEAWNLEEEKK